MVALRFTSILVMLTGAAVVAAKAGYAAAFLGAGRALPWAIARELAALALSAGLLWLLGPRAGRAAAAVRARLLAA